ADAVHEQVLRHDVIGGLLEDEPELAADVVFGVQATGLLEDRLAAHLLDAWRARPPRSALRTSPHTRPHTGPHDKPHDQPHDQPQDQPATRPETAPHTGGQSARTAEPAAVSGPAAGQ